MTDTDVVVTKIEPEDDPPKPTPPRGGRGRTTQRMSLRARVTMLAAACVAGAVALVSLGAFVTVRNNLYSQLENELVQRALEVAASPIQPDFQGNRRINAGPFQFSDIQFDIVDADGNTKVGISPASNRLPHDLLGPDEKAVAAAQDDVVGEVRVRLRGRRRAVPGDPQLRAGGQRTTERGPEHPQVAESGADPDQRRRCAGRRARGHRCGQRWAAPGAPADRGDRTCRHPATCARSRSAGTTNWPG